MKPGPKPKNRKLNDLQGNPGKRKTKKKPRLQNKNARFGIPAGMPLMVRRKIVKAAEFLEKNGLSKDSDRLAFERYCQHLYMADLAFKSIKKNGLLVKGALGSTKKNPAAQQHKENSLAALRYEEHFGLTPLSREKVHPSPEPEKKDPLKEFLKKGGKPYVAK